MISQAKARKILLEREIYEARYVERKLNKLIKKQIKNGWNDVYYVCEKYDLSKLSKDFVTDTLKVAGYDNIKWDYEYEEDDDGVGCTQYDVVTFTIY